MVHLLNTSESGTKSYHNNDIISTREHFDYQSAGQLIQGHNMTDYVYSSDLANNSNSKEYNQLSCPLKKEIAIYIHGVWTDERSANEHLVTAMSLASITLIPQRFQLGLNTPINKDVGKLQNIAKEWTQTCGLLLFQK
jgi:hypothetical protein